MLQLKPLALAILVCSLVAGLPLLAKDTKTQRNRNKSKDTTAEASQEVFAVVQVDDEVSVIKKSDLASFQKRVSGDYKAAVKRYNEEKKAALKKREAFTDPVPAKPKVKIISSSVKGEEKANELREKTLQRLRAFAVVQVGDDLEVVTMSGVEKLKLEANEAHREALRTYNETRSEALKKGEAFADPPPQRPVVKVLATNLRTEEKAQAQADALRRKLGLKGSGAKKGDHKGEPEAKKKRRGQDDDGEDGGGEETSGEEEANR